MPATDDLEYKYLFSHPELVRELITGFTSFDCLDGIDVGAFERVNTAYFSDCPLERQDDVVWRVKLGEQWLYIYILLEFQSDVDRWMALRMQVYIGLLYQDLVKRHELAHGKQLPPVLPRVFYNGRARWTAATSMDRMILDPPDGLAEFQSTQRYYLIDQYRLDLSGAVSRADLLGLLFRLELSDVADVLLDAMEALTAWARASEQSTLLHTVTRWVKRVINPVFDAGALPDEANLEEANAMAIERFAAWADACRQQGVVEGRRGILKRMIEKKGGAQSDVIAARIDHASPEEIDQWIERALDGDQPAAIFSDHA